MRYNHNNNIHDQLIDQMKEREFSLLLNEATGNSRDAHFICYVRFVDFSELNIVEELLFCKPIELGCRSIDLITSVSKGRVPMRFTGSVEQPLELLYGLI